MPPALSVLLDGGVQRHMSEERCRSGSPPIRLRASVVSSTGASAYAATRSSDAACDEHHLRDPSPTSKRRRGERVARLHVAGLLTGRKPVLTLGGCPMRERLGVDAALSFLLDAVVANRGRGIKTVCDVALRDLVDIAGIDRVFRPNAGLTVGLQL